MSRVTLSEVTGLPILGTVKLGLKPQQAAIEKRKMMYFIFAALMLVLSAISINLVQGIL